MAAHAIANADAVACPRCGYDQRGGMALWSESCPLDGVCAECGLQFEWREVLNPSLAFPSWLVEARRFIGWFPLQFLGTTWRAWLSPLLWRAVHMTHAIRRGRLIAWVAAWIIILICILSIGNGMSAIALCTGAPASMSRMDVFVRATLLPLSDQPIGTMRWGGGPASPRAVFLWFVLDEWWFWLVVLAIPLTCGMAFAALPISRIRAKVRWAHILRATAYAFGLSGSVVALHITRQVVLIWAMHVSLSAGRSSELIVDLASGLFGFIVLAATYLQIPALLMYWHACSKRYLRMQQAMAVALSVTAIGVLAPISLLGALWVVFDFRLRW